MKYNLKDILLWYLCLLNLIILFIMFHTHLYKQVIVYKINKDTVIDYHHNGSGKGTFLVRIT